MDAGQFSIHSSRPFVQSMHKDPESSFLSDISVTPTPNFVVMLLHVACECKIGKDGVGINHLMYDLAAAQNQLRTLGLMNEILYGVSAVRGIASIVWSRWNDGRIELGYVEEFDLETPSGGVMFCQFLVALTGDIIQRSAAVGGMTVADIEKLIGKDTWKAGTMPISYTPSKKRRHIGVMGGDDLSGDCYDEAMDADADDHSNSNDSDECEVDLWGEGEVDGQERVRSWVTEAPGASDLDMAIMTESD